MASRLEAELEKLDPHIPFRATTTHKHNTWACTFYSHPELYVRPQTLPEIQKVITLARRCRRRIVVVGCGHSPSDLTCTSSWMVNLDDYNRVLAVDEEKRILLVQGGIRLKELNLRAKEYGLTMPNLGSIDQQSIAGAIATATHGSSTQHGLLSQSVRSLRIVLANGSAVRCSADQNVDLFRAALVSLGALGIVVEVEFEMIPECNIEWTQTLKPLSYVLDKWDGSLWREAEYTRVWWLPYMKRAIIWRADKTTQPPRPPVSNWYGGSVGFHTYHILLYISNFIPRILPAVEWFVFGMQYGFSDNTSTTGVEELRTGLLMNCLYSQYVNEWALPLHLGPEAITRFSAWLNHEPFAAHRIPFSAAGLWVHAPVEVRVSDTSVTRPRPFLDNTAADGATLYLNATLYRPYSRDPPCRARYYEAFEWLMKQLGARPHWAKNFEYVSRDELAQMYSGRGPWARTRSTTTTTAAAAADDEGADEPTDHLAAWLKVRDDVDPDGMFVGEWHRRNVLPAPAALPALPLEERERRRLPAPRGGLVWFGEQAAAAGGTNVAGGGVARTGVRPAHAAGDGEGAADGAGGTAIRSSSSEESFDILHGAEAEASTLLPKLREGEGIEKGLEAETHGSVEQGLMGTRVFTKM